MNLFLVDQVKEVLSRAQHIHDPEVLTKLLAKRSIDIDTEMMARYINSFRYSSMLLASLFCYGEKSLILRHNLFYFIQ